MEDTARRIPRWTRVPRWVIVVAAVLVALIAFAAVFDWNWFKGPLERRVSAATGRAFQVAELDVDFGRAIRIRLEQPRLANARWSQRETMAQAARADFDVAFWPLLRGKVVLPAVNLVKPRLVLERNAEGEANWRFQPQRAREGRAAAPPRIDRLVVQDGGLEVLDPKLRTRLDLRVRSGKPQREGLAPPIHIEGGGRYRDGDFDLRGQDATKPLLADVVLVHDVVLELDEQQRRARDR